jgi:hypothetical protein
MNFDHKISIHSMIRGDFLDSSFLAGLVTYGDISPLTFPGFLGLLRNLRLRFRLGRQLFNFNFALASLLTIEIVKQQESLKKLFKKI